MLRAKNITYRVGNKTLLEDVSVDFEPGKINLIIGPNGAGKSTLIKILSGQQLPSTGEVYYNHQNLRSFTFAKLANFRSVLSQNMELAFPLTVNEVVMMGRYPHFTNKPGSADHQICRQAMDFFDVTALQERNYLTLSGGEKQRVHFARVAAQIWEPENKQCRFLLLDEPLTFLDIYYQLDFMNKLTELVRQQNMVVAGVVHDLNLAGKYAHHITLLHQGKVFSSGEKERVLTSHNMAETYRLQADVSVINGTLRLHF